MLARFSMKTDSIEGSRGIFVRLVIARKAFLKRSPTFPHVPPRIESLQIRNRTFEGSLFQDFGSGRKETHELT